MGRVVRPVPVNSRKWSQSTHIPKVLIGWEKPHGLSRTCLMIAKKLSSWYVQKSLCTSLLSRWRVILPKTQQSIAIQRLALYWKGKRKIWKIYSCIFGNAGLRRTRKMAKVDDRKVRDGTCGRSIVQQNCNVRDAHQYYDQQSLEEGYWLIKLQYCFIHGWMSPRLELHRTPPSWHPTSPTYTLQLRLFKHWLIMGKTPLQDLYFQSNLATQVSNIKLVTTDTTCPR